MAKLSAVGRVSIVCAHVGHRRPSRLGGAARLVAAGCGLSMGWAMLGCGERALDLIQSRAATDVDSGGDEQGGVGSEWSCLDQSEPPPSEEENPPALVRYSIGIIDYFSPPDAIPSGLQARACLINDALCSVALLGGPVQASELGVVTLDVPYSLYGFIRFDVPDVSPTNQYGYLPTNYYLGGPMVHDVVGAGTFLVSGRDLPLFATDLGDALTPEQGLLAVRAIDCDGQAAAGVQIELGDYEDAPGASWAVQDALVVRGSDADLTPPTDESGVAGFTNLLPRNVTLRALLPDGRSYGEQSMRVHAAALTMAEVRPSYTYGR